MKSEPRWRHGGLFCQVSCWAPRFVGACAALGWSFSSGPLVTGWETWWGETEAPFA